MKRIKIFLASSVNEFADERRELKDFIRRLSDVLIDSDIRLQLFICEYADNVISAGRMQMEYNKEIDDSDIFLLLAGGRLGEYTLEEYEYALKIKNEKDSLAILAAFKVSDPVDESLKSFAQRIANENISHITFETPADLKTAIAELAAKKLNGLAEIRIQEAYVIINGKKAARLS